MPSFVSQLRQVARRFSRARMFTAITLITLAVGIGADTAIFSVVNGVLLKPLPYPDPYRLVGVWETSPGINLPEINASPATYFSFRVSPVDPVTYVSVSIVMLLAALLATFLSALRATSIEAVDALRTD